MILDVGCGPKPRGDVNIDLFPKVYGDRGRINTRGINFIEADVSFLPIRSNSFETVLASHVLEHLKHPLMALEEWKRVASKRVIIAVPIVGRTMTESKLHLYSWSPRSLRKLLSLAFPKVKIFVNRRPMEWYQRSTISPIINFILRNLLSYISTFQDNEILAVGFI